MRLKKGPPDFILFLTTLGLLGVGLVMVYSSSAVTAGVDYHDPYYFFKRQMAWAFLGLGAMFIIMKVNYLKLKSLAVPLLIFSVICLILVITPLGFEAKGSSRSLGVGMVRFSPSELAKLAMILFLAKIMELKLDQLKSFKQGILPILVFMLAICGLILAQPDLGTSFVLAGTVFFMLVVAGARWLHLGLISGAGVGAVGLAIILEPYRFQRLIGFLDPWKYPRGIGFQTIQSLYALGSGGLFGMGLGRSRQKYFYLPEKHTDFIFAILGEELGFIGVFLVLSLFLLFAWRGYKIAMQAPDAFGHLLAAGVTTAIVFQAAINIGVVAGCLPVTGITLPFISYGGSSLLFTMMGVGLLLNISRYSSSKGK